MLSQKKASVPENLISLAKKTSQIPVGIVSAHQAAAMESAKKAFELNLIKPIFIGDKSGIQEEAKTLDWDINNFEIIDQSEDKEAAIIGAQLARDNEIKVLVKGNLHTDTLMRAYLKKEFALIEKRRLSHIWHMTTPNNNKPLFITDGALNVSPRIDVKMHILFNAVEFAKKNWRIQAACCCVVRNRRSYRKHAKLNGSKGSNGARSKRKYQCICSWTSCF